MSKLCAVELSQCVSKARETGSGMYTNCAARLLASAAATALVALQAPAALAGGNVSINGGAPIAFGNATDPYLISGLLPGSKLVNVTSNQNSSILNNTEFDAFAATWPNTVNIAPGVVVTSPSVGIWARSNQGDATQNVAGTINSVTDGILAGASSGKLTADGKGTGTINGGTSGITFVSPLYAVAASGDTTIQNFTAITGKLGSAIDVRTLGASAVDIKNNGAITGALDGIYVYVTNGTKPVTIDGNGAILGQGGAQGVGLGVDVTTLTGPINVTNNNTITSKADDAVWAKTYGGDITVSGNKAISGNDSAVLLSTIGGGATTGKITVTNNGDLTGKNVVGSGAFGPTGAVATWAGNDATLISGNGNITGGLNGVAALSNTGSITITNNADIKALAGNGANLGEGIWMSSVAAAQTVSGNGNIQGNYDGIYSVNGGAGTVNISVAPGKNVTGLTHDGIWINSTVTTATNSIDIGAGSTVAGNTTTGVGIATTTAGKLAINNAGTITTLSDDGAATTHGGTALWNSLGATTVNNDSGGKIIGGLQITGGPYVLNNNAGAVWVPNSDTVGAQTNVVTAQTTINNAGLINTRQGLTYLAAGGIGADMINKTGGIIDQTYGGTAPKATDSLFVRDFTSAAGSKIVQNVDFTASHNTGVEHYSGAVLDTSTGTGNKGTADTIVFGNKLSANATSIVDLKMTGAAPTASSGSIALITPYGKNASGKMLDPGLGGYAKMVASTNYVFASDPSTGAVVYKLVEDPLLGLYLQWAPNVSATSVGGYGGAIGNANPGSALAGAAGTFAGLGFGSGGALGRIGDMAASSSLATAQAPAPSGSLKDSGVQPAAPSGCEGGRRHTAWAQVDTSKSDMTGNGSANSSSFSGGIDTDVGSALGLGCNRVALGAFGFVGGGHTKWATGKDESENRGAGGYLRASSPTGFYFAGIGAFNWSDHDLTNAVYNSTAKKKADGAVGMGIAGFATPIAAGTVLDLRTFVGYGISDGKAFTDSIGISVEGSRDRMLTWGGTVGLHQMITPASIAFVRGGVKWSELDSSITTFGIVNSGKVSEVAGTIEAGLDAKLTKDITAGVSGFGEFSETTTTYGAKAGLAVRF